MKYEDLLFFLQEIWEQSGILKYLRINLNYREKYDLEVLQQIVIYGLNEKYFDLWEGDTKVNIKSKYTEIILDKKNWFDDPRMDLEIVFSDLEPWAQTLFDLQKVPNEFERFIKR
ncbi:hypothetical protein AB757_14935 [Listeria monocytogenes]|nr:hypothetical protein [Listeria monocytogenes]